MRTKTKKIVLIVSSITLFLLGGVLGYYLASPNGLIYKMTDGFGAYDDEKIMKLAYDDSYKVPEGFYSESLNGSSIKYYEDGPNTFYCAKSQNDATSTVDRYIVDYNDSYKPRFEERLVNSDLNETEKYYEFNLEQINSREGQSSFTYRFRIFKCDYISDLNYGRYDKTAYETRGSGPSEYAGVFAKTPISREDVYELAGFLWHTTSRNIAGEKVIASSTSERKDSIEIIIIEIKKSGGDWGLADIIGVYQSNFSVNKRTGEISYSQEKIKLLNGMMN